MMTCGWKRMGGAGTAAALLAGAVASLWLMVPPAARAQDVARARDAAGAQEARELGSRIAAAADGTVRFAYRARPNVCGDGRGVRVRDGDDDCPCEDGPVRVEIEKAGGRVLDVDMWVGEGRASRAAPRTDLGEVAPAAGAGYLLALARTVAGDPGHDAVSAAALADVVVWPDLLELARDGTVDGETREAAIFWLARHAGERATRDLEEIVRSDGDAEVREMALFALAQLPDGAGFDALVEIARDGDDPDLVQMSLFWLGQSGDPRALPVFEEILTRP